MFTNIMINSLENKGYVILSPEEAEYFDNIDNKLDIANNKKNKLVKKYNDLLKTSANNMTIKSMKDDLISAGITDIPKLKTELIDLYIKTFQE